MKKETLDLIQLQCMFADLAAEQGLVVDGELMEDFAALLACGAKLTRGQHKRFQRETPGLPPVVRHDRLPDPPVKPLVGWKTRGFTKEDTVYQISLEDLAAGKFPDAPAPAAVAMGDKLVVGKAVGAKSHESLDMLGNTATIPTHGRKRRTRKALNELS